MISLNETWLRQDTSWTNWQGYTFKQRQSPVDQWKSHFWYRRLWSFCAMMYSTLPFLIDIELIFNFLLKDSVPQYTHYIRPVGHYRRHFNVTYIWSKHAMH